MPDDVVSWRAHIGLLNCFVYSGSRRPTASFDIWYFIVFIANLINWSLPKCLLGICINFVFAFFMLSLLLYFLVPIHTNRGVNTISKCLFIFSIDIILLIFVIFNMHRLMLLIAGDIEVNPGPDHGAQNRFSFGFWNVDSLLAREGSKITHIEALQSSYNFDVFGICETYLNDAVTNEHIAIEGFSSQPFRKDCTGANVHPRGGVCLYFKENTPIIEREDLAINFSECIVSQIQIKNKNIFFVLIYRSPSQNSLEFSVFMNNVENLLCKINNEKPSVVIFSGDFNARSPLFWDDEGTETKEGKTLADFMIQNNLQQLINEPTNFPRENVATCINLVLTDQPLLFVDHGIIPSPDVKCKHHIVNGNLNFRLPCPPKYKRRVWDYPKANFQLLRRDIRTIQWHELFAGKSVDAMTETFTTQFLELISRHIPSKIINVDDKDAPWVTPDVKTAIKRNKRVFSKWCSRGRNSDERIRVLETQKETRHIIQNAKATYIDNLSKNLCDPRSFGAHLKD